VFFGVFPRGVVLVVGGFQIVTEGDAGVMRRFFVIAGLVMLGGFTVMLGGLIIVLGRMFVMLVNFVVCHFSLPELLLVEGGMVRSASPTHLGSVPDRRRGQAIFKSNLPSCSTSVQDARTSHAASPP
jgi:hypothetical protein